MEKFRWMGMAIAAVLFSVGLTSCGGDDDVVEPVVDESGVVNNLKKLASAKYYSPSGRIYTYNMDYDTAGKLSSVVEIVEYDSHIESWVNTYSWSNDLITEYHEGTFVYKLYLYKGHVISADDETYVYDSNNKINRMNSDYFTWDGDRLVKVISNNEQTSITYSGKTCTGPCLVWNQIFYLSDYKALFYAHPELFGIYTSELPAKIVMTNTKYNDETTYEFQYEFTKDNYVSKVTGTETYDNGEGKPNTETLKYELTWE